MCLKEKMRSGNIVNCFYFEHSFFLKKEALYADALILLISVKSRYSGDQIRPHLRINKEPQHST